MAGDHRSQRGWPHSLTADERTEMRKRLRKSPKRWANNGSKRTKKWLRKKREEIDKWA